MKTLARAAAASLVLLTAAMTADPAFAQAPPCGNSLETLTTYTPRAVHAGELFAVESEDDAFSSVENEQIHFAGQTILFDQEEGGNTRVLVPAPSTIGLYPLTITWLQPEEGTSCTGIDRHDIHVVRPGSRIGDTDSARVAGRWAMNFFPANFRARVDRTRWRWRPLCDVGACGARVRSSTGNRLRIRFDGSSFRSQGRERGHYGSCTITRSIGDIVLSRRTIAPAYRGRFEHDLKVTREIDNQGLLEARALRGVNRLYEEPVGAARSAGCPTKVWRWRVVGRRL